MVSRTRTRDGRYLNGGFVDDVNHNQIAFDYANVGLYETCKDTVGELDEDNLLDILTQENRRWFISGKHEHPVTGAIRYYTNMPVRGGWSVPPSFPSGFGGLSTGELSDLAWQALGRTNPNTPHVSVPQFVGEMKDIPSLVEDWGGSLLKKVAKGYITWRWAIRPMINDVMKLYRFQDAVNQRMKTLRKLRDGETLKRRTSLGSDATVTPWVGTVIHSKSGLVLTGQKREHHSYKRWATVRWKVHPSAVIPEDESELRNTARRLTKGLTSHQALATAWELTPWSWFADWFGGFGDIINATNNSVPVTHSDVCVMQTSQSKREYRISESQDPNGLVPLVDRGKPMFESRTRKERRVAFPVLPFQANFPLLEAGKLSILGSLAVLRTSK